MSKKRVVAKVDGSEIYFWQYNDAMVSFANEVLKMSLEELSSADYERCSNEAMNKVLASELFYLDAFEAGVNVTEAEVDEALRDFLNFIKVDAYKTFLEERELTEEEFKDYLRKQLIKERYVNALLKRIPEPTEEEVEKFYQKTKDKITMPPQFSFTVAYIDNDSEADKERFKSLFSAVASKKMDIAVAEKIIKDIKDEIAAVNVVNYENKTVESMSPQVKSLLLSIEDEHFSPIYEAPEEVSIFYMKKKELNIPMTEDECRKEAGRYYKVARLKNILDAYVETLKEKRKIEVFL
ncbi:MAG: hypothetical protein OHK0040_03900 [bacterium]